MTVVGLASERFTCPYCEADLHSHVLSCRSCGRDLTPVLPLLRRLADIEMRLTAIEASTQPERTVLVADEEADQAQPEPAVPAPPGRRRIAALAIGFAALLAVYWMVVIWLDLPLLWLRLASIAIPFVAGAAYLGRRAQLSWTDSGVAILFAVTAVTAMNGLLGWIDSMPAWPQLDLSRTVQHDLQEAH